MTLHFTSLCLLNWLDNLVCVMLLSIVLLLCRLFVLCVRVLVMSMGIIIKLLYMIHCSVLGCFPLVGIMVCWLLCHNSIILRMVKTTIVVASYSGLYEEDEVSHINCVWPVSSTQQLI